MIERHPYKPDSRVPPILLDLIAAIIVGVGIGLLLGLGL